jgi:hypothetical protein
MSTPRKKSSPRKVETRGRPEIPPDLRKVNLSARVPKRVLAGFDSRAAAHGLDSRGKPRSSRGLEIERAFDATQPPGR